VIAAVRNRSVFPLFALLCAAACASPTLPLPPPTIPMQSAGVDADHITLSSPCGGAEADALIIIINRSQPPDRAVGGSEANDCGAWDASVLAHSGDVLNISQESGDNSSTATVYTVR
jgi:hypothetical protein